MMKRLGAALGVASALLCRNALVGAAQRAPAGTPESTVVVMLGTGTPRPLPDAWGPATAVVVGKRVFLVDAGVGVERRLAAAGLPANGVTAAFITHLHSDHVLGLPDLIFTSWVMGRTRPFPVYGPHGLAQMTEHLYAAFSEDIRVRKPGELGGSSTAQTAHRLSQRATDRGRSDPRRYPAIICGTSVHRG